MKQRTNKPQQKESGSSTVEDNPAAPAKFELPIDFDDIVAAAVLDSILKSKRSRSRKSSAGRRSKL